MINDGRVPSLDPLHGDLVRTSTSLAQAATDPGEAVPRAQQWALNLRTTLVDLTLDGDRLLGRPRGSVGYTTEITAAYLETWASQNVAPWRLAGMDRGEWAEALRQLTEWVRQRDHAAVTATPADARRHAELAAERARVDRRAELARQRDQADAELASIDRGDPLPTEAAPRPGGWLKRRPTPP